MKRVGGALGSMLLLLSVRGEKPLGFHAEKPFPHAVDTPTSFLTLPPQRVVGRSRQRIIEALKLHEGRSYPVWARLLAQQWQGIPYGSGGAGLGPTELLLNLEQMDCMTAVENLLALHQTTLMKGKTPEDFAAALAAVRYHAVPPCRWEDRYHYLTHAFIEWEEKGWGTWLPLGIPDNRPIHYITHNPKKYGGFTDWTFLRSVEGRLSTRPRYYIPSKAIHEWLPFLQDGDLIAFVSPQEGLDVSHVGVFFWEGEKATFSHASLIAKKWVYGEDLCAYLDKRGEKVKGITVFRPF
ncbi:MAG: DUF1460 domain-containing protein [Bacteroidia bacterium]|nr:DUF1460 domain-containing protein [Bacteroidia bacterium]MCX7764795.1 DUF1460 domain-containing protein [Bacteroidia bacterium]MDW8057997.1 DUF1460 domain-containing protein [Bacteroidia bacterium]